MERRAGPLLANRSLSALIVVSFVLSAFAGLYIVASPSPTAAQVEPIGDLVVTSGTYTIEDINQPVDGDVIVSGGELIVRNGALMVISDGAHQRTVTVSGSGRLVLEHGELTSYLDQIDPWPFLTLTIDGGTVVATDSSILDFPGFINVQNGGELRLYGSSIEKIPDEMRSEYFTGWSPEGLDEIDDGPAITIDDASLMMFDSSIPNLPESPVLYVPASNMTLIGESTLLAVNSYISADFGPGSYVHNAIVINDSSTAHLYGTYFEQYDGDPSDRVPAIIGTGESYIALPSAKGPEDTTLEPISDLTASGDGLVYLINPDDAMAIDAFSTGSSASVNGATLYIRYAVQSTYDGTGSFTWREEGVGSLLSTGITPVSSETSFVVKSFDLYSAGVTTTDDLATIDVNFAHDGDNGAVLVDSVSLVISIGPEAYIYRWASVTVGDEYGVPIPDCEISSVFTGSVTFGGQPSFYFWTDGVSATPPAPVLEYMGQDTSSFGVTDSSGMALMPLLTDMISGWEYPNSFYVGTYELTGTFVLDSVVYSSTETFSFIPYPAMDSGDQQFEVTVDIEGVSAESPDTSRWLVVPPDLIIEDMEYYHAGDVIVASDGTLTLRDSVFRVVQSVANEFTIYVDGTSNFIIENSELVSDLPLDLIVKGEGTLEVRDSTLTGVNIEIMENAEVILDGAEVSGTITTSWDSEAHIVIQDSVLDQPIVLSGDTVCEITDISVPSVVVEDSAVALIYRWIYITVFDGGDMPLEGAVVSARFYVNETHWASDETDSLGVARLNSLGTILTSTGSTYVGQYRVNSSYWSDGVEHVSDADVNVSVQPYSEPLTDNATYAILTMSTVLLPDLSVTPQELWTEPSEVVYNTSCSVVVRVWNLGVKIAENTLVEFYNGTTEATAQLIDTYTVASISPGGWSEAYVTWTPMVTGQQTLWVRVNDAPDFDERSFDNNYASITVTVRGPANLRMDTVEFYVAGTGLPDYTIPGGLTITVRAELTNSGEATVSGITVRMTVTGDDYTESRDTYVPDTLRQNYMVIVQFTYTLPIVNSTTEMYFELEADPSNLIVETNEGDNVAAGTLQVLDIREDLRISVEDITIDYVGEGADSCVFGDLVKVVANVFNDGGTDVYNASIEFGSDLWDVPIATQNVAIPGGSSKPVTFNFTVNITTGDSYTLYMFADPANVYSETNESNNGAEATLVVEQLTVDISIKLRASEYQAEDTLMLDVTVNYSGTSVGVAGLSGISMELINEDGDSVQYSSGATTTSTGEATLFLNLREDIADGTYRVLLTIEDLTETEEVSVDIQGIVSGGGIPLLVWILVVVIIAAVVIGFTVYTYVYGLGKLVECGECGEFIPASNKRCPKCGVEFEVGTMKCSECGAWVPAESAECPNCGVKFVGEEVDEGDYLDTMRKEYDEMVSKYRELAKPELGKKFSDKKFDEWWAAQPTYISFDDWLAKQEEKRKEGPVACPVCGTLNPKEATVCNRCGTVFGPAGESSEDEGSPPGPPAAGQQPEPRQQPVQPAQQPAEQPPQQTAPKMVIRRPIDRKVVPKKVIRTPINQGESGGEGNEGSEGQ